MSFCRFTDSDDNTVYVNPSLVRYVRWDEDAEITTLTFGDGQSIFVLGKIDRIVSELENANRT